MWPEQPMTLMDDEDESQNRKHGLFMILITLLLILALLATLVWPLLQSGRRPQPTPKPHLLQEA